jgi:hypothetical protein
VFRRIVQTGVFAIAISAFLVSLTPAQTGPSGGLSGVVTDPSGRVVSGADVKVQNRGTAFARDVKTNDEGYWETRFLPTGRYEVTVEKSGFQKLVL